MRCKHLSLKSLFKVLPRVVYMTDILSQSVKTDWFHSCNQIYLASFPISNFAMVYKPSWGEKFCEKRCLPKPAKCKKKVIQYA